MIQARDKATASLKTTRSPARLNQFRPSPEKISLFRFNLFDTADRQICKLFNQVEARWDVLAIVH